MGRNSDEREADWLDFDGGLLETKRSRDLGNLNDVIV